MSATMKKSIFCILLFFFSLTLETFGQDGELEPESRGPDTTGKDIRRKFKNCGEIQRWAERTSEIGNLSTVQTIYPNKPSSEGVRVLCDFELDGGGWTVLQNRGVGPREEFYRGWDEYVEGFGKPGKNGLKNYWIGLENMHKLSSLNVSGNVEQTIRFELMDWENVTVYAQYTEFSIESSVSNYRLRLGSYSGDAGNSMTPHDGCPFTTKDRDNDYSSDNNCGVLLHSGFWFSSCYNVNLNGFYWNLDEGEKIDSYGNGIVWYHFHGAAYSLKHSQMKIRDSNFLQKV